MTLTESGRHGSESRVIRLHVKKYRENLARTEAANEIKTYYSGEPSIGFYPPPEDNSEASNVIFLADAIKKRDGDLAKRRGVIINTLLRDPDSIPKSNRESFKQRHLARIERFAKTLKNKGRLVLGLEVSR